MEKIYLVGKNGIFPIAEAANIDELFKKIVSGETMERGFGTFEVMVARGIVCFKLNEHLERLLFSLKDCRIKIPYSIKELSLFIANALKNAGLEESIVRLDVILGEEDKEEPLFLLIKVRSKKPKKPLALKTYKFSRTMPDLKVSGGYVYAQIRKRMFPDYDDILYVARNEYGNYYFTETSRGNFFVVDKFNTDKLYGATKNENILNGVTRQTLLKLLEESSVELAGSLFAYNLENIKEAFVTSTTQGVVPVRKIDNVFLDVGEDGKGGFFTRRLSNLFDIYIHDWFRRKHVV